MWNLCLQYMKVFEEYLSNNYSTVNIVTNANRFSINIDIKIVLSELMKYRKSLFTKLRRNLRIGKGCFRHSAAINGFL